MDLDHLARIFNTAIITSRTNGSNTKKAEELSLTMSNPEITYILKAVHDLSQQSGRSELESAERIIAAFRDVDSIWTQYVSDLGMSQLKNKHFPTVIVAEQTQRSS